MTEHQSAASGEPRTSARAFAAFRAARNPRRLACLLFATFAALLLLVQFGPSAGAASQANATLTVVARDFASQTDLSKYNFIVNVDNSKLPGNPTSLSTESNSAIVAIGNQTDNAVTVPTSGCPENAGVGGGCRYLISVRARDHKMWGQHVTVTGAKTVTIDLTEDSADHPLRLGKIRVFVFRDNTWTNGAPDTEEGGLGNFQVGLEEQTGSAVTVDYHNNPLCGGICTTSSAPGTLGFVEIPSLGPATYNIDVHPPAGPCNSNPDSQWYQTTTIDGGFQLLAPTEEGADGTGAPGEQLWEPPNIRTAYWFGFVCAPQNFATPGTGEIVGTARNWVEWAPYTYGTLGDTVENPLVALSDASTDQTVYVGRGDAGGNFDIQNVPAGDYNLAVWDEQLNYIMRFKPVTIGAGQTVDVDETGDDGSTGLGVSRWFGWLEGTVYKDVTNNGKYDPGADTPIGNTDVDQRWRDGSIKEGATTDPSGHYEYPTAEGGALGRWFVNEQGFSRFSAFPGASIHDERDPYNPSAEIPSCAVAPPAIPTGNCIPNAEGGGLLVNQSVLEGHRSIVDWGKRDYAPGTPGQIVGITYFATTRNEFEAYKQAHEDYEPAIPDVTVYLESTDGTVLNTYSTDHWAQPNASQDPLDGTTFKQNCNPILDHAGNPITGLSPLIGPNCLEVPLAGAHTKEGKFDGGYAFATYCPESTGGINLNDPDGKCVDGSDQVDLVAGTYVTHAVMPTDANDNRACNPGVTADGYKRVSGPFSDQPSPQQGCLWHPVREEDVNVDLGNQFETQIPQPPCAGDLHKIDQSTLTPRSTFYTGNQATSPVTPLCDKREVVLENGQNANADFYMMTNFITDPNGEGVGDDSRIGDVNEPGRLIGQVFNDIYFERNKLSPWYGEPRPIPGIPVGIYARVDTNPNAACPQPNVPDRCYTPDNWRLITTLKTTADGAYEALLPSTETFNCPIPQGPCPGMYIAIVNDPGTKAHPNAGYNPNVLTANTPFEVWPGLTTQLDTPVDPISGTACEDPAGAPGGIAVDPSDPAVPELLQVSQPYVNDTTAASGGAPNITIQGDFIGVQGPASANGGHVNLTDVRTGQIQTLTRSNGGIVSWTQGNGSTADTIVIHVPRLDSTFRAGPKQLAIVTANNNPGGGGVSSRNGITLHVRGSNTVGSSTVTYTPNIVPVPAPTLNGHELQNAINGASAGDLLVLSPGTYNENLLMWKPVRIQGLGPGGIIGAHEFQGRDPEDPRFNVAGTVIDGRFHQENLTYFNSQVSGNGPFALADNPLDVVLNGADITAVSKTTGAYNVASLPAGQDSPAFNGARIDGLGLMTGSGQGAGGLQLMANINNLQITNNILENNGGVVAGGIGVGQLFARHSHNNNVRISNNRLIGNGGLTTSGGLGIFYGSDNYEVARNVICANFSVEYGAGISHIGLSPGGSIHDNRIFYNDSVDSGAGIAIETELPKPTTPPTLSLGDGSGTVNVDRNLIQSNFSGDDGGGIFVLDALNQPINIRNNMIVDNGAADMGGALLIDDSSKVSIINNTIAGNVSTGSSENSGLGTPHAAGLGTEKNEDLWQNDSRYAAQYPNAATRPTFSQPLALFNNIFWQNQAYTLDQFGPGAVLVNQGFIDFEIRGTTPASCIASGPCSDTFTPNFSDLTAANTLSPPTAVSCLSGSSTGQLLGPDGCMHALPAGQANMTANPGFTTPFILELAVGGSRLDPQQAAVTITGADPPVGLTGDYHVGNGSPVVDRGAGFSNVASNPPPIQVPNASSVLAPCSGTNAQAYPGDYDGDLRPQRRTNRNRTPWDLGADERPGSNVTIPSSTFVWNLPLPSSPKCIDSTETR